MNRHKHAMCIKAWADGAEIQVSRPSTKGPAWIDTKNPDWDLNLNYRVGCTTTFLRVVFTGSPEHIEQLRRDDPSGGEATHFSLWEGHTQRYHKRTQGQDYFWGMTVLGELGWCPYGGGSARFSSHLGDAICLIPTKVKLVPTKKDFKAADVRMNAKFEKRNTKINETIRQLMNTQQLLKSQYSRKQRKVQMLYEAAPV